MREIIVDFTADIPIEPGTIIGRQGENNATDLKIKIPTEMLNSEDIVMVSLAAQVGAGYVARSELIAKDETISVKLDSRMTAVNSLSIQLEGYDSAKSLIVKSAKVDNLILEKSVTGETPELSNDSDIISSIAANTAARHTHSNSDTLDKLGDSGGSLTYDGKPVGERKTIVEIFENEFEDFEFTVLSLAAAGRVVNISVKSDLLNENSEIKSIKIKLQGRGFVDVKDFPILINSGGEPCILSAFHPVVDDSETDIIKYKICSIYFPNTSAAFNQINSGNYSAVAVEFYGG